MPRKANLIKSILPFEINDRWFALTIDRVEGITPVKTVTRIPGNKSRALIGLGYVLGQLMSVIDCGPILNLGASRGARQAIITRYQGAYYALLAGQVGQLITNPKIVAYKKPLLACTAEYTDHQKKKITLIDIQKLIEEFICK